MRVFHIEPDRFTELPALPDALPERGFLWLGYGRREFEVGEPAAQQALVRWGCGTIVDLHVSDLINNQLPSQFDYTSWYDMLVFRRLAAAPGSQDLFVDDEHGTLASAQRALRAAEVMGDENRMAACARVHKRKQTASQRVGRMFSKRGGRAARA